MRTSDRRHHQIASEATIPYESWVEPSIVRVVDHYESNGPVLRPLDEGEAVSGTFYILDLNPYELAALRHTREKKE